MVEREVPMNFFAFCLIHRSICLYSNTKGVNNRSGPFVLNYFRFLLLAHASMLICSLRASSMKVSGWEMLNAGYLVSAVSPTRANSWEAKGEGVGRRDKSTHKYKGIFKN